MNPADAPILIIALTSDSVTRPVMYDVANSILSQKLSQIGGVGQVFVGGAANPAVRAELNPMQLNGMGLGIDAVRTALGAANAHSPKGKLVNPVNMWAINDNDQILKANEYRPLIIGYNSNTGAAVRLSDVAEVDDSVEDVHTAGLANGHSAVLIIIYRQLGANIIGTVNNVRALLPQLQASISPAIKLGVVLDRSITVRASVHDIEFTLIISIVLVILVVFAFLRLVRATIIPSVAVPLSL